MRVVMVVGLERAREAVGSGPSVAGMELVMWSEGKGVGG